MFKIIFKERLTGQAVDDWKTPGRNDAGNDRSFFFSSFEELWRGTAFGEVYDDSWQAANWILISTPWLPLERSSVLHCTAGRQRRRTELEAEETGESELETTIKQFLSSRLYGIAERKRLQPEATSVIEKKGEKKGARGKKPNSLNIDQQFVYSLMWPILTSQPYSNIECL